MPLTRIEKKQISSFFTHHGAWRQKAADQGLNPLMEAAEQARDFLARAATNAVFTGDFGTAATDEEKTTMMAGAALHLAGEL